MTTYGLLRDSGGIRQDKSVAQQRQEIEELCQHYGVDLAHLFGDEARIEATTVGRDALEDLLYLTKQDLRPVDGIIFWSFARLARDQIDSQFVKAELRHRGYILYSMTDDILDGEFGPVIETLIDWKNKRFLKDLSREVRRGLADLTKMDYAPGGFPPHG